MTATEGNIIHFAPKPASKAELDEAVQELAKLSPLEFDQIYKDEADRLGVRPATLDREVKRARRSDVGHVLVMQAHWSVEPWHEPVKPGEIFARIKKRLMRHVVMGEMSAIAVALWSMFAWVHDAAVHSPILLVSSPEAECGKTTLLGLISLLVPKGCIIVEVSPAVLYRMIEKWQPSLIVDEADVAFKNNPELRAVINAGWTRGTGVPRCHPDTHEPEFFETFGPKAIGMKGLKVPDTTLSRSIIIDMQRKLPGDTAENFAHTDDDDLAATRRHLARFAGDFIEKLKDCSPRMPDGFTNRLEANWRVLLAIAELCGPTVAAEARKAAEALSRRGDEASLGVELLRDIREILVGGALDRIRSEDLVSRLVAMEDRPWPEMPRSGKPLTQPQLSKLLRPYRVKPDSVYFGGPTFKGYQLEQFTDAFRYIPEVPTATGGQNSRKTGRTTDFCESSRKNLPGLDGKDPPGSESRKNLPGRMANFSQSSGLPGISPPGASASDSNPFESLRDPRLRLQPKRKD